MNINTNLQFTKSSEVESTKKNVLNKEIKGLNIENRSISTGGVSEESASLIERTIITLSESPIDLKIELSSSKEAKIYINNSSIHSSKKEVNAFTKEDLLQKIGGNERHGLKYISLNELDKIVRFQNNKQLPDLSTKIKNGDWAELLNCYGCKKDTPYLLLASFCQDRITLDELSTALIFCRAFRNFNDQGEIIYIDEQSKPEKEPVNVKVVHFDPDYYSLFEIDGFKKSRSEIENFLSEVNPNQHFFLLVRLNAFDSFSQGLINGSFGKGVLGIREYDHGSEGIYLGIASFGLAKKFYSEFVKDFDGNPQQELTPALGLTPTLKEMGRNLLQGFSDVAILTPGDLPLVHGSHNALWAYMHDLFHATVRAKLGKKAADLIRFALIAADIQKPDYSHKIHYDYGMLNPEFQIAPTQEEVVSYVIDMLCSDFVDGTWTPPPGLTVKVFLESILIKIVVQKVMGPLKEKFHLHYDEVSLSYQVINLLGQVWDKYEEEMKLNG